MQYLILGYLSNAYEGCTDVSKIAHFSTLERANILSNSGV